MRTKKIPLGRQISVINRYFLLRGISRGSSRLFSSPVFRLALTARSPKLGLTIMGLLLLGLPLMWFASTAQSTIVTVEQIQCSYNPNFGQSNPLGGGAFITVTQNGADTTFRYESLPSLVQMPDQAGLHKPRAVTLEHARTMVFYNTQIEVAREIMRVRRDYYYKLIGFEDEVGFAAYDDVMSCE